MPTLPEPSRQRRLTDALLKVLDLSVFASVALAGVLALSLPTTLGFSLFVSWVWGLLLTVGGTSAFFGRIFGVWFLEAVGLMAGMFGTLIYMVVLLPLVSPLPGTLVILALISVAFIDQLRRYVELQTLITEPDERSWVVTCMDAVRRRLRTD